MLRGSVRCSRFVLQQHKCFPKTSCLVFTRHVSDSTSWSNNNANSSGNNITQRDKIKSFFKKNHTNTEGLNAYLNEQFAELQVGDVAQLLYSSALNNHTLHNSQLEQVINALESYTAEHQPKVFRKNLYNPVHFSRMMYGLKVYSLDSRENGALTARLLTTLNSMLVMKNTSTFHNPGSKLGGSNGQKDGSGLSASSNSGMFDARSFSMCVFGLQGIRARHQATVSVLTEIVRKFREVALHLDEVCPTSLSYMLHGTQSLNKSNADVQELLAIIINKAAHMKAELFTYQLICNNISGLFKHNDFKSREALSLLHILTMKFQQCNQVNSQELDSNLMGVLFFQLQAIDAHALESEEVVAYLTTLTDIVESSRATPSPIQIANMLYSSKHMASDVPAVRRMHKVIIDKAINVRGKFSPRDISKCVSSLQHINMNHFELQPLVPLLSSWLSRGLLNRRTLNTKDIEACLYGCRHIKFSDEDTRQLMSVFATHLHASKDKISQSSVAHAFYLLRSADCVHEEVQAFITALHDKIKSSAITIHKRQVNIIYGLSYIQNPYPAMRPLVSLLGSALAPVSDLSPRTGIGFLGGLRKLRCEYPETRTLLTRLLSDVETSGFKLHQVSDIGYSLRQAFYVFQNMTSEHAEVREFLCFLTREIELLLLEDRAGVAALDAAVVTDCLYCLRGMKGDSEQVKVAISLLTQCAKTCRDNFKHADVARALYGLKSMSSESPDVRALVSLLTSKLTAGSDQPMTLQEVGMALIGLQSMSQDDTEVGVCLQELLRRAAGSKEEGAEGVDLGQVLARLKGTRDDEDVLDVVVDGLL